jgi:predicted enzyme related to lactoylglutathione lyase
MTIRPLAVAYAAADPGSLAGFWAQILGREVVEHPFGVLLPGFATQLGLLFRRETGARDDLRRMHVHLTSDRPGDQARTVAAVLAGGGSPLDVGQLPKEGGHVVVADPEGNEFCVIEAGNAYLAGTGFLGELACDGGRDVGLFWSAALGWPLVWDQDQETAIQSPEGGTKIAWGGPPVQAKGARNRQQLILAVEGELAAEVERLVGLGARVLDDPPPLGALARALADPEDNEFWLTT